MNKILLFGTVIFSILAFSGYKAFAPVSYTHLTLPTN